jgi:hypothetical protein
LPVADREPAGRAVAVFDAPAALGGRALAAAGGTNLAK